MGGPLNGPCHQIPMILNAIRLRVKSWAQRHVYEELGALSLFGSVGNSITFWKSWAQCHILEELGTVSHFGRVGHNVTFLKS